jgi:hypothetical protein
MLIYLLSLLVTHANQDTLILKNGKKISMEIKNYGVGKITGVLDENKERGITTTIDANRVALVKFQDGRMDTVPQNLMYINPKKLFVNKYIKQNHMLDISLSGLYFRKLNVFYNYQFQKQNIESQINYWKPLEKGFNFGEVKGYYISKHRQMNVTVRKLVNRQSKFTSMLGFTCGSALTSFRYRYDNYAKYSNMPSLILALHYGYRHFLNNWIYLAVGGDFGYEAVPAKRFLDQQYIRVDFRTGIKLM